MRAADVPMAARVQDLRQRADDDALAAPGEHESGRHRLDVSELGLRVAITRARYPNRADGIDMYAVTITRLQLDHRPADPEVEAVLVAAFGNEHGAVERPGGQLVRMFRVRAGSA